MAKYPFEKTKDGEVASGAELHHYWLEDIRKLFFLMLDRFGDFDTAGSSYNYWRIGFAYTQGTTVYYKEKPYVCLANHTSSLSNAPDLDADRWELVTVIESPRDFAYWQAGISYKAGQTVTYLAAYYVCLANHTSAESNAPTIDATKWDELSDNPELMPWCSGRLEQVLYIEEDAAGVEIDATGTKYIGAAANTDPRKANCYGLGGTFDGEKWLEHWGSGQKYFWTVGQNSGRGFDTLNHIVGSNFGSNGDVDGFFYDAAGPCIWYNGDWSSAYNITAQTETTIAVAYSASRAADFQVGMPIRMANCGTNTGVYRILSFVIDGGSVVITLADQDDVACSIDPDQDMGTVNCDFGGDYFSCAKFWFWGSPTATTGNIVNSPFSLPPRGGKWAKSKLNGWARSYIPNRYYHWDRNGERYFCGEAGDVGSYSDRTLVKTCIVVPLYTLLPRQTDPKEQKPPIIFEDTGRVQWRYGDKVELAKEIFTGPETLMPAYAGIERAEQSNSGVNYPYSHDSNYTTHEMTRTDIGGELFERIVPFLESTEWWIFSGQATISNTAPETVGHASMQQSYQNMIMWLISRFETQIVLEVDAVYKYNFIKRMNCINQTAYTVNDYDVAVPKFPSVAAINDPCWGCNGSGFELLLKKIGSFDWWLDVSTPYTPVDVLNYRVKNNTKRKELVYINQEPYLRDLPPIWRDSQIQAWMNTNEISSYPANMVVSYNGSYYKRNAVGNEATWTAARWTQVNIADYRLIDEDDWYLPLSKGTWRRTWKYGLGRIPGVIYMKGTLNPEGSDYTAGSTNGGGSSADYPSGVQSGAWMYPVPPFVHCDDGLGGVWSEYSQSSLASGVVSPYFHSIYPWPVHKTDAIEQKYSTFLKGHYNTDSGLYETYTTAELDAIRYGLRSHSCAITAVDGSKVTVDQSVYDNCTAGFCVYVIDSGDTHHETFVERKERTGTEGNHTYDLYLTDAIANADEIYYDDDICSHHDPADIIDGVKCYEIKAEMILDLREVFDFMDTVFFPEQAYLNIFTDAPHYTTFVATQVSRFGDRLGLEEVFDNNLGDYRDVVPPWVHFNDQSMKDYLAAFDKEFIRTKLAYGFPFAGGDLIALPWAARTYNTGDKATRGDGTNKYVCVCRKDNVTSDPLVSIQTGFYWEEHKDLDWDFYRYHEFEEENTGGQTPLITEISDSDGGLIKTTIPIWNLYRGLNFYRQQKSGYYVNVQGVISFGCAAIHYAKMHPKFNGCKIRVTLMAASVHYGSIGSPPPGWKAATLVSENFEVATGGPYALDVEYNEEYGGYVYKEAVFKKITLDVAISESNRYVPIFVRPDQDYTVTTGPVYQWRGNVYMGMFAAVPPIVEQDYYNYPRDLFNRDYTRAMLKPSDPRTDIEPPQPDPPSVLLSQLYDANAKHKGYDVVSPTADNDLYLKCRCTVLEDYEGSAVTYEWKIVKIADGSLFKSLDDTLTNQLFAKISGQFDGDAFYADLLAAEIGSLSELGVQARGKDANNNCTEWSEPVALEVPNSTIPLLPQFEVEPYIDPVPNKVKFTVKLAYASDGSTVQYRAALRDPVTHSPGTPTALQSGRSFELAYTDVNSKFMIQVAAVGDTTVYSNWATQSGGL
ncbi:MAG: hypothetical protein LLF76_00380 [Planctomycetaceae bacterium]|nr:hypothetical protein [Planctomycetaceae bacterium]